MEGSFKVYFYESVFGSNTFYGESFKGDWKMMPEGEILKIEYIANSKKITLEGYKEYNHLFPRVNVMGNNGIIPRVFLVGRKETSSDIFVINFELQKIFKQEVPIGQEYGGEILRGWRAGKYDNPRYRVE